MKWYMEVNSKIICYSERTNNYESGKVAI